MWKICVYFSSVFFSCACSCLELCKNILQWVEQPPTFNGFRAVLQTFQILLSGYLTWLYTFVSPFNCNRKFIKFSKIHFFLPVICQNQCQVSYSVCLVHGKTNSFGISNPIIVVEEKYELAWIVNTES